MPRSIAHNHISTEPDTFLSGTSRSREFRNLGPFINPATRSLMRTVEQDSLQETDEMTLLALEH